MTEEDLKKRKRKRPAPGSRSTPIKKKRGKLNEDVLPIQIQESISNITDVQGEIAINKSTSDIEAFAVPEVNLSYNEHLASKIETIPDPEEDSINKDKSIDMQIITTAH